jgi:alkaline phosphatase D
MSIRRALPAAAAWPLLLAALAGPAVATHGPILSHGPVLGGLTPANAKVFVRTTDAAGTPVSTAVSVRYSDNSDLANYFEASGITTDPAQGGDGTAILTLAFLAAACYRQAANCYYTVMVGQDEAIPAPYPSFKTLPPAPYDGLKLVVVGDTGDQGGGNPHGVGPVFVKAAAEGAFVALLPGDFDHQDPKIVADKRMVRKNLYDPVTTGKDFATLARRTPIAYVWDDHDYGGNNADGRGSILTGPDSGKPGNYPFKCESISVYMEYVPSYPLTSTVSDACGPHFTRFPDGDWPLHTTWPVQLPAGIWQSFKVGQVKVILLDTRTQRNKHPSVEKILDAFTLHLQGQTQMAWLEQQLTDNSDLDIVWRVVVSSSVWNRTLGKGDSWTGFPADRTYWATFLRDQNLRNVIFVSGDVHWGALDDGTHGGLGGDCSTLPASGCPPQMVAPNTNMTNHTQCTYGSWPGGWTGASPPEPYGVPGDADTVRCDPDPDVNPDQEDNIYDNGVLNGYGLLTFYTNPHRVVLEIKNQNGTLRRTLMIQAQP